MPDIILSYQNTMLYSLIFKYHLIMSSYLSCGSYQLFNNIIKPFNIILYQNNLDLISKILFSLLFLFMKSILIIKLQQPKILTKLTGFRLNALLRTFYLHNNYYFLVFHLNYLFCFLPIILPNLIVNSQQLFYNFSSFHKSIRFF